MSDNNVSEFTALVMQGLANQRSAGFDEAAKLFAENQILRGQMQVMKARLEELESQIRPAEVSAAAPVDSEQQAAEA